MLLEKPRKSCDVSIKKQNTRKNTSKEPVGEYIEFEELD